MKQRVMAFVGTARELGEFLSRAMMAQQHSRQISDAYFYGRATRDGYLKQGGFVDLAAFDRQQIEIDLEEIRKAG